MNYSNRMAMHLGNVYKRISEQWVTHCSIFLSHLHVTLQSVYLQSRWNERQVVAKQLAVMWPPQPMKWYQITAKQFALLDPLPACKGEATGGWSTGRCTLSTALINLPSLAVWYLRAVLLTHTHCTVLHAGPLECLERPDVESALALGEDWVQWTGVRHCEGVLTFTASYNRSVPYFITIRPSHPIPTYLHAHLTHSCYHYLIYHCKWGSVRVPFW